MTTKIKVRKLTKASLRRALNSLGSTSREVAAKLARLGVRGRLYYLADACPVANYMKNCFGPTAQVCASQSRCSVRTVFSPNGDDYAFVTPPPPVAKFIDSFDKGHYRQLREEPKVADDQTP